MQLSAAIQTPGKIEVYGQTLVSKFSLNRNTDISVDHSLGQ